MRVAAIFYGAGSGILRRMVVTDSPEGLAPHSPAKGEDLIVLNSDEVLVGGVPDLAACIAQIEQKRGQPSESARVIVVDDKSGEIVNVIQADPALDVLPGQTLFQEDKADIGWTVDATGKFVPPVMPDEGQSTVDAKQVVG